ncbi:MAG: hypothetical protein J5U16_07090, partial [Candidatus Methanoperedens sp.]|nr:hypothetical protein [Candidatus Methanoperedens sp.]
RVELRAANKCHPILEGGLQVKGGNNAELILNGIMVCRRTLDISEVKNLSLRHCTLVPGTTSLRLNLKSDKSATGVEINHSIISSLRISSERSTLNVQDSIIHSMDSNTPAIAGIKKDKPGPSTTLERATIIGTIYVKELKASNVIFTGSIASDMQQTGCIRFSYIPPGSQTPRSYRCQPDLAVQKKLEEELEKKTGLTPEEIKLKKIIEEEITLRLKPVFTDLHYGNPGYCQLLLQCPVEISQGADDGAEMGVFHDLFQPQRETNLQVRLNEYLRFGLEAGIFYVR